MPPMKLGPSNRRSLWGGVVVTGAGDGVVRGAVVVLLVGGDGGVGLMDVVGEVGVVGVVGVVAEVEFGFNVVIVGLVVLVVEVVGVAGVVLLGVVPSAINIIIVNIHIFKLELYF